MILAAILVGVSAAQEPPGAPAPPPAPPPQEEALFGLDGREWTVAYGGALGVYGGGTLVYMVQSWGGDAEGEDVGLFPLGAVLGGGAVGLGTATLLMRDQGPSLDQAMHLGSSGVLGTFGGFQLARALIPPGADAEEQRIAAAGLLGATAGTGLGLLTLGSAPSREQTFAMDLGALVGWQAGAGGAAVSGHPRADAPQIHAASSLAGAAVLGVTAGALDRAGLSRPEPELLMTTLGQGAWIGLWTPWLIADEPSGTEVFGALRLGLGAGYLGALVAAPVLEPSPRSTALQAGGALAGNALGAGLPLAFGQQDRRAVLGPMLGGSVAGQVVGAVIAPRYDLSEEDVLTLGVLESWTLWQSLGWNLYSREVGVDSSRALGLGLTLGGAGTAAAIGLAPVIELSPQENALLFTGAGWGTWTGGFGALLLDGEPQQIVGGALVLGDLGMLGAATTAAFWDPSWLDVGLINGVGALGGALGGLSGVIFLYDRQDPRGVATLSLVGSTLGLGAGAVLAARSPETESARALVLPGRPQLPVRLALSASPWLDEEGQQGWSVQLSGWER